MYGIRRVQDAQEPGLDVRYPAGAGHTELDVYSPCSVGLSVALPCLF